MVSITSSELKERLHRDGEFTLVDVREPHEHQDFNIGGKLLPLGHIMSMQTEDIEHLKEEELICYCRSGQRSMQACLMLESCGFKNVKNLVGGMLEWELQYGR